MRLAAGERAREDFGSGRDLSLWCPLVPSSGERVLGNKPMTLRNPPADGFGRNIAPPREPDEAAIENIKRALQSANLAHVMGISDFDVEVLARAVWLSMPPTLSDTIKAYDL